MSKAREVLIGKHAVWEMENKVSGKWFILTLIFMACMEILGVLEEKK